jgi:recombination DNA repair RAD52 pathway protein
MTCTFSAEQITALSAPLDRAKVRQREQGRSQVSYLEGWQVIAEANRIFGLDGWQRETVALRCVNQSERTIGARGTSRDQKPGWGVTYIARVRISVSSAGQPALLREGCGAGHGIDVDLGQAHESALKEAETDAMKRALMTFGNPFGLALYDKRQREVTGGRRRGNGPGPGRPAMSGPRRCGWWLHRPPGFSLARSPRRRRHRKLSHPLRKAQHRQWIQA